MKKTSRILLWVLVVVIVLVAVALLVLPAQVEKGMNKVYPRTPYQATTQALTRICRSSMGSGGNGMNSGNFRHRRISRLVSLKMAMRSSSRHTAGISSTDFTTPAVTGSTIAS